MRDFPIYLDYQSTTPCDPRVIEKFLPYLNEEFGNPHSRSHAYGWRAEEAVQQARLHIAQCIGADPREIIFTSGATESNNLALQGVALFQEKGHIITVQTEHKCVIETVRALKQKGFDITFLRVNHLGLLDLDELRAAIRCDTFLVSVMAANHEIGVIQPLKEIGAICQNYGIYFHTDAAQAFGKISLNVKEMGIDLMSLSGHKIYGPKGIGALYVRRRPHIRMRPILHGGGQERGIRSGTLAPFLCVGFGYAAYLAHQEMSQETVRILALRNWLYQKITTSLEAVFLNGDFHYRLPGNLNLSFFGVEGEGLIMGLKELALSSGSACTSASLEPSYVLKALGIGDELAHTSLRISIGRYTTQTQIEKTGDLIIAAVQRLRAISPLWEMRQEGIDLNSVQWIAH
jgi:cysteine desulfurase